MANNFPEATARPWRYHGWDNTPGDRGAYILGGGPDGSMDEHMVGAALPQPSLRNRAECEANAKLIVTAVNSYDALREAAEAAFKYIQVDPVLDDEGIAIVAQLRAALHPQPGKMK